MLLWYDGVYHVLGMRGVLGGGDGKLEYGVPRWFNERDEMKMDAEICHVYIQSRDFVCLPIPGSPHI